MAFAGGRSTWVEELAKRLDRETSDPHLRAKGRLAVAHVRAVSGRGMATNAVPMNDLEGLIAQIPEVGIAMLALAAGIGFSTGDEPLRSRVQAIAKKVPGSGTEQWRLYALAACDASANARAIDPHLGALVDERHHGPVDTPRTCHDALAPGSPDRRLGAVVGCDGWDARSRSVEPPARPSCRPRLYRLSGGADGRRRGRWPGRRSSWPRIRINR